MKKVILSCLLAVLVQPALARDWIMDVTPSTVRILPVYKASYSMTKVPGEDKFTFAVKVAYDQDGTSKQIEKVRQDFPSHKVEVYRTTFENASTVPGNGLPRANLHYMETASGWELALPMQVLPLRSYQSLLQNIQYNRIFTLNVSVWRRQINEVEVLNQACDIPLPVSEGLVWFYERVKQLEVALNKLPRSYSERKHEVMNALIDKCVEIDVNGVESFAAVASQGFRVRPKDGDFVLTEKREGEKFEAVELGVSKVVTSDVAVQP